MPSIVPTPAAEPAPAPAAPVKVGLIDNEEITFPPFKYSHLLSSSTEHGDWRDQLAADGFYVVKEAIPKAKALEYRDRAHAYQEAFGLGYKRDDPATFVNACLPAHMKGGMLHGYGIGHEQWVWDVRAEPGVIDGFAKVWGTSELVTSFDGASIMLPGRKDVPDQGKWEHTDQSPSRRGFYCVQGIVNLNENGPDDGGLLVLKGSSQLFEEFFDVHGRKGRKTWGPADWAGFDLKDQQWFFDRGCKWEKVCAGPGDLILWDSRTLHYNCTPSGTRDRVCTYVCMAPAALMTAKDKTDRRFAFDNFRGTTHVPYDCHIRKDHEPKIRHETGLPCALDDGIPRQPREATLLVRQLAGVEAY